MRTPLTPLIGSHSIQTSVRTLDRARTHLDLALIITTLGVRANVFEEDVGAMIKDKSNAPTIFPHLLRLKPGAASLPVFPVREKDPTKPMSYSTMSKIFLSLCKHLEFQRTLVVRFVLCLD
jgi:hypothetical protein